MVWPCRRNGQNKDTENDSIINSSRKELCGMSRCVGMWFRQVVQDIKGEDNWQGTKKERLQKDRTDWRLFVI